MVQPIRRSYCAVGLPGADAPDSVGELLTRFLFDPAGEGRPFAGEAADAIFAAAPGFDLAPARLDVCESEEQFHVRRWLEAHDIEALAAELGWRNVGYREPIELPRGKAATLAELPVDRGWTPASDFR